MNQGQNSDMGEGGIKKGQKNSDVSYGRSLTRIFTNFGKLLPELIIIYALHLNISLMLFFFLQSPVHCSKLCNLCKSFLGLETWLKKTRALISK